MPLDHDFGVSIAHKMIIVEPWNMSTKRKLPRHVSRLKIGPKEEKWTPKIHTHVKLVSALDWKATIRLKLMTAGIGSINRFDDWRFSPRRPPIKDMGLIVMRMKRDGVYQQIAQSGQWRRVQSRVNANKGYHASEDDVSRAKPMTRDIYFKAMKEVTVRPTLSRVTRRVEFSNSRDIYLTYFI